MLEHHDVIFYEESGAVTVLVVVEGLPMFLFELVAFSRSKDITVVCLLCALAA